MSPYQEHKKRWLQCRECGYCETRRNVVLVRGKVPAEVLFVGEAPGASENVLGKPFCGPAGQLLDQIIERGIDGQADYALTNLVGCIPIEDGTVTKAGAPSEESILACQDRLEEIINLVNPNVIVRVGKLATKWLPKLFDIDVACVDMIHPAAILRMDASQKPLAVQRCVVTLEDIAYPIPF